MAKKSDYEAGYRAGRNNSLKSDNGREYRQGYVHGKQEYDFWNDKNLYPGLRDDANTRQSSQYYDPLEYDPSTLSTMIGGSISLALIGWAFAGAILFLLWILGMSGSFLFQLIFQVALWGGIGFIVVMSAVGVIMTILEKEK